MLYGFHVVLSDLLQGCSALCTTDAESASYVGGAAASDMRETQSSTTISPFGNVYFVLQTLSFTISFETCTATIRWP